MIKIIVILIILCIIVEIVKELLLAGVVLFGTLLKEFIEFTLKHNIAFYVLSTVGTLLFIMVHWKVISVIWIIAVITTFMMRKVVQRKREKIEEERIQKAIREKERQKRNLSWVKKHTKDFIKKDCDDMFNKNVIAIIKSGVLVDEYLFTKENMLYGRANAFLTFFNKSIYAEEVYAFFCEPSKVIEEFREYGTLITDQGIYTAYQLKISTKEYRVYESSILFEGLKTVEYEQTDDHEFNMIHWTSVDKKGDLKKGSLRIRFSIGESIYKLCEQVIESGWSCALFENKVYLDINELHIKKESSNVEEVFQKGVKTGAAIDNINEYNKIFDEVKNYMNGSRGGGYAAEYANNTMDRLSGKDVESTAQILDEHGRQVKAGADRTVNNVEIQTKYYKNAQQSIGAVFKNEEAIYIRSDGTKKMMQIEVPRDQYEEAIKYMQKRIDEGQVPGIEPGEDAYSYVRKGFYTYAQANNVALSGTIESLTVDTTTGVICARNSMGISAIMIFAQQMWEGKSLEEAIKASLEVSAQILGTSVFIYMVTMQMTREKLANPFVKEYLANGELKGYVGVKNPVYAISSQIVDQIKTSSIAKSQFGKLLHLSQITERQLIAGSLVGTLTFGPDIYKVMQGRISVNQFVKNSAIATAGIVGATIGNTALPGVGGIVGGAAGSYVAKKLADELVEDDYKKMMRVLKEEFIEAIFEAGLKEEELQIVIKRTVGSEELSDILERMCASSNYHDYAKNKVLMPVINSVIVKRQKIKNASYSAGLKQLYAQEMS